MNAQAAPVSTDNHSRPYLKALVYRTLLAHGGPMRLNEVISGAASNLVPQPAIRFILGAEPDHFMTIDRKWAPSTMFEDNRRPLQSLVLRMLDTVCRPVPASELAWPLAGVYSRVPESMQAMISRMAGSVFGVFPDGLGRPDWLLEVTSSKADDVAFDNMVDQARADKIVSALKKTEWSIENLIEQLLKTKLALSIRSLQYIKWRLDPSKFDAMDCVTDLWASPLLICFPAHEPDATHPAPYFAPASLLPAWLEQISEEIDAVCKSFEVDTAEPLELTDDRREAAIQYVLESAHGVMVPEIARNLFDLSDADTTWKGDLQTIRAALEADSRVSWLGGQRFGRADALPPYVLDVPSSLVFPVLHFESEDGEPLEIDLDDDGLSGTLKSDLMEPLAQDVLDEEEDRLKVLPVPTSVRCVVKARHKEIGTFPLCQIPEGFFPSKPQIQVLSFTDTTHNVQYDAIYLNHGTRLLYGLMEFYLTREPASGLVFTLTRTSDPCRYEIAWEEELEPRVQLSASRYNDLLARAGAVTEWSTFELMAELLTYNRKGMDFLNILTEVNVLRRTTRRRVASILSAFPAFYVKGGLWHFDEKKRDTPIEKAKRKYVRR